ncbi:MAG TPA: DUF3488 and transglutaminase-like domain-containing protein, partial [Oscillatoriaceae cyanobacterium]
MREAEDSIRLRLAVYLNTACAFLAYTSADPDFQPALPLLVLTAGSAFSHWRRRGNNFWLKWLLAAGMIYALYAALQGLVAYALNPRLVLGQLLVWLQVLNSFDLPRRRNLRVALMVTSVLVIVAATLSRESSFGVLLLASAVTLLWAFHEAYASELGAPPLAWPRLSGSLVGALALTVLLALPLYALAPRRERTLNAPSLPVSVSLPLPRALDPSVRNPDLASNDPGNGSHRGYDGFSDSLDLNVVPAPSDVVVLRVKSDRPAYWRAMAFDRYDGLTWRMSDPKRVTPLADTVPPIHLALPDGQAGGSQLVQTFYIERDQANLIFSAWTPTTLYYPSALVWRDAYDSLRSPTLLEKDTYYSVVSEIPSFDASALAARPARKLPSRLKPYLQLPPLSERVRALTHQLADGKTPYSAMRTLRDYLRAHYVYRLNVAAAPPGHEWVDHFLFEQHAGFCEQFATTLAVMGRVEGVPTRLVTGYLPGDYNPLTGFWEVHGRDAHAWVEAWMPMQGWVPFDATPAGPDPADFMLPRTLGGYFWSRFAQLLASPVIA